MNGFEWNVLFFLGLLVALAAINHYRILKIKDEVYCTHDMIHHMMHTLFGEDEDEQDTEEPSGSNTEEIEDWDNALK